MNFTAFTQQHGEKGAAMSAVLSLCGYAGCFVGSLLVVAPASVVALRWMEDARQLGTTKIQNPRDLGKPGP